MAILVDIDAAYSPLKTSLKGLYLRLDWVKVYPKYKIVKFIVKGYLDDVSGKSMRDVEYEQFKYIDAIFKTNSVEVANGEVLIDSSRYRDNFTTPGSSGNEPMALWEDVYSMKVADIPVSALDVDVLYPYLYTALKADPRFSNVRDELSEPANTTVTEVTTGDGLTCVATAAAGSTGIEKTVEETL